MSDLKLLVIVDNEGKCFLFQSFSSEITYSDQNIFSGFIFAINQLANQMFKSSVEKFRTSKLDLYYYPLKIQEDTFYVIIGANKSVNPSYISKKIKEVSDAFMAEYSDNPYLKSCDAEMFEPFIDTVDKIFGIKTTRIIPEHEQLIEILKKAEEENYTEEEAVNAILSFLESLTENKLKIILQNSLPIIAMFMESDNLNEDQISRFQAVLDM